MTVGEALVIVHATAKKVRDDSEEDVTELGTALDLVEDLIVNEYNEEEEGK